MRKKLFILSIMFLFLFGASLIQAKKGKKIAVVLDSVEGGIEGLLVDWNPLPEYFKFKLQNNTGKKISIIWDECLFVNEFDESSGIMHLGVKYIDKEKSMPETIVPNGTSKSDMVYPRDYAFYGHPKKWTMHGPRKRKFSIVSGIGKEEWQTRPIFFAKVTKKLLKDAQKEDSNFDLTEFVKGLHYKVILVLKVGDEKHEVTFKFNAKLI
jgi:hypothetical protein